MRSASSSWMTRCCCLAPGEDGAAQFPDNEERASCTKGWQGGAGWGAGGLDLDGVRCRTARGASARGICVLYGNSVLCILCCARVVVATVLGRTVCGEESVRERLCDCLPIRFCVVFMLKMCSSLYLRVHANMRVHADVGECPYIAQKCQARSRESAHVPYTCVPSHSGTHHTDQGFTTSRPRLSLRRRSRLRRSERIFLNEINVNECPSAEVRRANRTASSALSVSSIIPAPAGIGPSELAGQDDFWRRGGPQSGIDYRSDIGSITPMMKAMSMSCSHWR